MFSFLLIFFNFSLLKLFLLHTEELEAKYDFFKVYALIFLTEHQDKIS